MLKSKDHKVSICERDFWPHKKSNLGTRKGGRIGYLFTSRPSDCCARLSPTSRPPPAIGPIR